VDQRSAPALPETTAELAGASDAACTTSSTLCSAPAWPAPPATRRRRPLRRSGWSNYGSPLVDSSSSLAALHRHLGGARDRSGRCRRGLRVASGIVADVLFTMVVTWLAIILQGRA
jgi:hypothetical protein